MIKGIIEWKYYREWQSGNDTKNDRVKWYMEWQWELIARIIPSAYVWHLAPSLMRNRDKTWRLNLQMEPRGWWHPTCNKKWREILNEVQKWVFFSVSCKKWFANTITFKFFSKFLFTTGCFPYSYLLQILIYVLYDVFLHLLNRSQQLPTFASFQWWG